MSWKAPQHTDDLEQCSNAQSYQKSPWSGSDTLPDVDEAGYREQGYEDNAAHFGG